MRTLPTLATLVLLTFPLAACGGAPDATDSTTEDDLSTSSLIGTYAIVGHDALTYTSFELLSGKAYTATGLCPKASWGIDCSQAKQYNGKWSIKGSTITFTGDIHESFTFSVSSSELHLSETSGANETSFKKEATNGKFKPGEVCADMFGNPLGECEGGDNFGCSYSGPNTNEQICAPDW